jgi:hypothetical protein
MLATVIFDAMAMSAIVTGRAAAFARRDRSARNHPAGADHRCEQLREMEPAVPTAFLAELAGGDRITGYADVKPQSRVLPHKPTLHRVRSIRACGPIMLSSPAAPQQTGRAKMTTRFFVSRWWRYSP